MNVQDIIKESDPIKVQRFLHNAQLEPRDQDVYEMAKLIIEKGMSAYQAAKALSEEGTSVRSIYTLYYHSRLIVAEIYRYLTGDISALIADLSKDGEIFIPEDLVPDIRRGAKERGWDIREDIRVRIIKRNIRNNIPEQVDKVRHETVTDENVNQPKENSAQKVSSSKSRKRVTKRSNSQQEQVR